MMRSLALILVSLFLLCMPFESATAQEDDWVKVSPKGERFTVLMPKQPVSGKQKKSHGPLSTDASLYTAKVNGTSYAVWSLRNTSYPGTGLDTETYLDACADLVWESLLKPERDKLPDDQELEERMTYYKEFSGASLPGREYLIRLDRTEGVTHFYVAAEQIYVLVVMGAPGNSPQADRFLKSFSSPSLKVDASGNQSKAADGMGTGPGRGGDEAAVSAGTMPAADDNDPNRVFTSREVTQKARLLERPEPQYTESARRYGVQGTVLLLGVFSKDGEVTNLKVIKGLPHGLTKVALAASRQIRFIPAVKDGRNVSQRIQIQYNFNLY